MHKDIKTPLSIMQDSLQNLVPIAGLKTHLGTYEPTNYIKCVTLPPVPTIRKAKSETNRQEH
jgi:hypothetical protein